MDFFSNCQAAIIARTKESTAEMLNDLRNDFSTMEEELQVTSLDKFWNFYSPYFLFFTESIYPRVTNLSTKRYFDLKIIFKLDNYDNIFGYLG